MEPNTTKQISRYANKPVSNLQQARVAAPRAPGLQHAEAPRAPVARWLQASTTSSTTMVAGLQQAAVPRASVAIG
eukprot:scaffold13905_cov69-Phaeocystis_antarctica.AAC.2